MLKDVSKDTGQFGAASVVCSTLSVAATRRREGGATLLSTGSHESCVGCTVAGSLKSGALQYEVGVDEICEAGSTTFVLHWRSFISWT